MTQQTETPHPEPRRAVWHTPLLLRRIIPPAAPDDPGHYVEARWPIVIAAVAAVGLHATLPAELTIGPTWLIPVIEGALLLPLLLTEPHWHRISGWQWQRRLSLLLVGFIGIANLASLGLLISILMGGSHTTGAALFLEAGKIWLTNVLVFALGYWELDRGGPRNRHWRTAAPPDFLFPQMSSPEVAPPRWMPTFVDYFYLSFTNATAFSPTDTLPLGAPAKMLMLVQSAISLLTIAFLAGRAVNILT
jgi:hypothetical protein